MSARPRPRDIFVHTDSKNKIHNNMDKAAA